jgi:hypothetical protein
MTPLQPAKGFLRVRRTFYRPTAMLKRFRSHLSVFPLFYSAINLAMHSITLKARVAIAPGGAHRCSDRHLPLPGGQSHQQKVCSICSSQQRNDSRRRLQHHRKPIRNFVCHNANGEHLDLAVLIYFRVLRLKLMSNCLRF